MMDEHLISLQPGTVIAGRYEIIKCLGAGSMGVVYACRHRELSGHMVAIKVLYKEVVQDKIASARFRNEIFAAYGVSHPNVVRAYEYFRDGDLVAYTMEYVGGSDLAARLDKVRTIGPEETINILSQMCSGVQAIHDAGIVHRDLKPENILLSPEGIVKIADFGIAKASHGPKLTEHGGVVGTIDYVSPEYMLNSQVDWRSDIYAIGILAYEMLTGESPFRGGSVYETMTKRLNTDPTPVTELQPACSQALQAIVEGAMKRDPEERYQSAAQIFYDLQKAGAKDVPAASSAYLQMASPSADNYVGPSLNQSEEEKPASAVPNSFAEEKPQSPADLFTHEPEPYVPSFDPLAEPVPGMREPLGGLDSAEEVDLLSEYQSDETVYAPMKSVLGKSELETDVAVGANIITNTSSIDEDRMQRLAEIVDRVESSPWLEIAALVIAILIGLGVGFFVVKWVSPGLFGEKSEGIGVEASIEDNAVLKRTQQAIILYADKTEKAMI